MEIERFLMIERNLFAFAAALRRLGRFRFALTVRSATTLHSRPHEVRFARDAAAPNKSRQEQQGKKQTGKGSTHVLFDRIKFCRLGLYSEVAGVA